MTPLEKRPKGYRPDIDGLRALAVGVVILFHFELGPFQGGFVGVDVFFVVSGYLITGLLRDGRGVSLAGFAERRLRRLLPAMLVVLAASCLGAATLLPNDLKVLGLGLITGATFTANLYFLRLTGDYFAAGTLANNPALHLWSLGVEAQFYVAMALLWMVGRRWPRLRAAVLGMLGILAFAASLWALPHRPQVAFYLMPLRFWEFMIGSALVLPPFPFEKKKGLGSIMAAGGVALIVLCVLIETPATPFPGLAALPPCLGAALAIRGGAGGGTASRWLGARWLAGLGRLSYSLYLWHWPVLVFATYGLAPVAPLALRVFLLVPTFALASATYRLVERPVIERRWLGRPAPFLAACVLGVVAIAMGGLIINLAGQDRLVLRHFPPSVARLAAGQFDRNERNCQPREAEIEPACRFGVPGVAPVVLLWGNSFARMWLPALDGVGRREGTAGMALLLTRCPPLPARAVAALEGCAVFNREALVFVDAHPSLRTVVLGGNWSAWTTALPSLRDIVEALLARGRRVVVILSPPAVPYPVPRTLALATLNGRAPPPLVATEAARRDRSQERETIASLAASVPVTVIDPFSVICGATGCAVAADGRALYYDREHVTGFGAVWAEHLFDPLFTGGAAE